MKKQLTLKEEAAHFCQLLFGDKKSNAGEFEKFNFYIQKLFLIYTVLYHFSSQHKTFKKVAPSSSFSFVVGGSLFHYSKTLASRAPN